MRNTKFTTKYSALLGGVITALALGGCAGDGSMSAGGSSGTAADAGGLSTTGNGATSSGGNTLPGAGSGGDTTANNNGNNNNNNSPALRTTGDIAASNGNILSRVGDMVTTAGGQLAGTNLVNPNFSNGLGGVLENSGAAVSALGTSTFDGLGKIGTNPDPIGTTLSGLPVAVQRVGDAVSSGGNAVKALDDDRLSVLRPVTQPAGTLVDKVGRVVNEGGSKLGEVQQTLMITRVTQKTSRTITPIANMVVSATQAAGSTTRLGQPVDNLVTKVGRAVEDVGGGITGRAPNSLLGDAGAVVSSVGVGVQSLGGAFNAPAGTQPTSTYGSATTALAPATSLGGVGGALTPVTNTVSGVTVALAPVSNVVAGTVSGVTNTVGGAVGGSPLGGLLGGLGLTRR